ncbi:sigma-70 family RNA polymerase sigma factor [Amycolatopsis endophytica]|uniref:RNA polymerase sigma-70 factor (ECF subfamily) n=1 Tax=Amycolatopsis endophytica TaxID=860233 RepID=A0A853BF10_9PSEU|nr:sigma factor-like helix-turn-helix DNA-binding protein [Amycolatopsis endophytica]NYI93355.1 RNA polymerase sigma-70 factor (ECF subfamily) [Amycolatopsis endophytica]
MTAGTTATVFSDAGLVTAAADGDAQAITDLVDALTPVLVRYCRARLGPAGDDIAQEACVAILHALPRLDGSFTALVYDLTAEKVDAAHVPEAPSPVMALPPGEREIVVLRVAVGLSAEETAEALGMPVAAVRVTQHRALDRLRRSLEQ